MSLLTSQAEGAQFCLPPSFCSTQVLRTLDDAHLHYRGQAAVLSLPIHMLISPGHILRDTPRDHV